MRTRRAVGRIGALAVTVTIAGIWTAASASAHVTVTAPGVTAGAIDAAITFRVPDESDSASTVGLKLQLPTDHPIAGVLVAPQPGWTATIKQAKLSTPITTDDGQITEVVSEVDWTANPGAGVKPGFFGAFTIIGGKLPDGVTSLVFKAIQTYSDGKQVAWIEQPAPGSNAEPEHPAPTLQLAAAPTSPTGAEKLDRTGFGVGWCQRDRAGLDDTRCEQDRRGHRDRARRCRRRSRCGRLAAGTAARTRPERGLTQPDQVARLPPRRQQILVGGFWCCGCAGRAVASISVRAVARRSLPRSSCRWPVRPGWGWVRVCGRAAGTMRRPRPRRRRPRSRRPTSTCRASWSPV